MINGILTFSNNKNVIAVKCGDVGAVQYQLFWKTEKESTLNIIHLERKLQQKT